MAHWGLYRWLLSHIPPYTGATTSRRAVRPFPTRHSAPSVPTISSCVLHALCASMSSTIHARDHRVRVNLPLYPLARAWYLALCVIPGMLVSVREECGHGLR